MVQNSAACRGRQSAALMRLIEPISDIDFTIGIIDGMNSHAAHDLAIAEDSTVERDIMGKLLFTTSKKRLFIFERLDRVQPWQPAAQMLTIAINDRKKFRGALNAEEMELQTGTELSALEVHLSTLYESFGVITACVAAARIIRAICKRRTAELDADEGLALVVSVALTIVFIVRWYGPLLTVTPLAGGWAWRLVLGALPVPCLIGLQFILIHYAAHEVREQGEYDVLFIAGGVAWLCLATASFGLMGVIARDDAIESRNPVAIVAVSGAWLGVMICYGAANIGEGPTVWTTFVPAAAATASLMALWMLLTATTGISEAITVDRDIASGMRLGGFMIAGGFVLGNAVAGDWHSWDGTWHDFIVQGWPVVVLAIAAGVLQITWRPTSERPVHPVGLRGLVPALLMICCAVGWILLSRRALGMGGT